MFGFWDVAKLEDIKASLQDKEDPLNKISSKESSLMVGTARKAVKRFMAFLQQPAKDKKQIWAVQWYVFPYHHRT